VIFDAHPKEFIGVKLHQTVFLTGLDIYTGTVCIVQKQKQNKKYLRHIGLAPLIMKTNLTLRIDRH